MTYWRALALKTLSLLFQLAITIIRVSAKTIIVTADSNNKLVGAGRKKFNISFIINIFYVGNLVGNINVK